MIYGTYPRDIDVEKAIRVIELMTIQEMVDAGFRGIRQTSTSCPVAHGLQKMLHWEWVNVGHSMCGTFCGEDYIDEEVCIDEAPPFFEDIYNLPGTLQTFIQNFDKGCYPELDQQL